MTDLTERLAAKLEAANVSANGGWLIAPKTCAVLLPLLLSEPELVASLSDEVRLSVLTPRERAELRMGRAYIEWVAANEAFDNDESHGPRNEVVARFLAAKTEYLAALAEARALTTEGKDG